LESCRAVTEEPDILSPGTSKKRRGGKRGSFILLSNSRGTKNLPAAVVKNGSRKKKRKWKTARGGSVQEKNRETRNGRSFRRSEGRPHLPESRTKVALPGREVRLVRREETLPSKESLIISP